MRPYLSRKFFPYLTRVCGIIHIHIILCLPYLLGNHPKELHGEGIYI
jgi:hypothetical protein